MYWRIIEKALLAPTASPNWEGRFVLHAHRDAAGPHLDLRLEWGDYLLGYRVAGEALAVDAWATEKAPHPRHWLTQDGAAERRDAGRYAWATWEESERSIYLQGAGGIELLTLRRESVLSPAVSAGLRDWLAAESLEEAQLRALAADGLAARRQAMDRIHGLARVLDAPPEDALPHGASLGDQRLPALLAAQTQLERRFDARFALKAHTDPPKATDNNTTPERDATSWALLLGSKSETLH